MTQKFQIPFFLPFARKKSSPLGNRTSPGCRTQSVSKVEASTDIDLIPDREIGSNRQGKQQSRPETSAK
jgi:hypothetical protein